MALSPGARIGPYEVSSQIGVGGMGEVYRAADTNLKRAVALKVLPASLAADADRLARFQREAELLAALNHPNIAAIYGLERSGSSTALVMELVDGPTLADRLARGPMPLDEARAIGVQIAEALEAAHDRGIVHRDLKPANIKVRPDGTVKVLDFGLAKAMEARATAPDLAASPSLLPTMTSPALVTGAGTILGTAAYMSPEQARGSVAVDRRADVWALGAVLFEMLAGPRAFPGDTVSDVLAAVILQEPDWSKLPSTLPQGLSVFLRRCLQKDARQRVHAAGDVRLALEGAFDVASASSSASTAAGSSRSARLPWAVAAVAAMVALSLGVTAWRGGGRERPVVRTMIPPPDGAVFDFDLTTGPAVLSPDGTKVAFSAVSRAADGKGVRTQLWVRALDTLEARPLEGTENAQFPFWSPDSQSLGFEADTRLHRVSVAGGAPVVVAKTSFMRGGSWGTDGTIVYDDNSALMVVAPGGQPHRIDGVPVGARSPWLLPGGRYVLYFALARNELRAAAVAGGDDRLITQATSNAVYSAGRLLFMREGTLLAQPFDAGSLTLSGSPVAVASDVAMVETHRGIFSASEAGSLLYQPGARDAALTLAWFDQDGRRLSTLGNVGNARNVALSPDARVTALTITDAQLRGDLWRVDTVTGQRTRLTSEVPPNDVSPFVAWAPDGQSIAYAARRQNRVMLIRRQMSGGGREAPVLDVAGTQGDSDQPTLDLPRVTAWSRDGSLLSFSYQGLMVLPMGGAARDAKASGNDEGRGQNPRLSPNGRWVSYQASRDGGGVLGVFVDAFPGGDHRQQVAEDGTLALWGPDGNSFYYLTKNTLVRTDVREADGQLAFSPPRAIMPVRQGRGYSYDVAPDGRILALVTPEEQASRPLTLVQNWLAAITNR